MKKLVLKIQIAGQEKQETAKRLKKFFYIIYNKKKRMIVVQHLSDQVYWLTIQKNPITCDMYFEKKPIQFFSFYSVDEFLQKGFNADGQNFPTQSAIVFWSVIFLPLELNYLNVTNGEGAIFSCRISLSI